MPVISIAPFTPLSKYWSKEQVCSAAMVQTATDNNEEIQLENVRNYLNQATAYISNLLNLAERPFYGIYAVGVLESAEHLSGLEFITLRGDANFTAHPSGSTINPATFFSSIKRVSFVPSAAVADNQLSTDWIGNCARKDINELTHLRFNLNTQQNQSIYWCHFGDEILFYIGDMIVTPARQGRTRYTASSPEWDVVLQNVIIWGYRKPILDNLRAPHSILADNNYSFSFGSDFATGSNYSYSTPNPLAYIDLPDEYVDLAIKLVQSKILSQLNQVVPAQLEAEINQGVANIQALISSEIQFEKAEQEKRRYGVQQRPPGIDG